MPDTLVKFNTERRIHIGLAVSDVEASTKFYRALFEVEPSKTRPGYARFEVADPPLNLSVNESAHARGPSDPTSHYGVQVKSTEAVAAIGRRLEDAGMATRVERAVQCCHAVQDKVWIEDPDGHRWEVFVVLDDAPDASASEEEACCVSAEEEPCGTGGVDPCCPESD